MISSIKIKRDDFKYKDYIYIPRKEVIFQEKKNIWSRRNKGKGFTVPPSDKSQGEKPRPLSPAQTFFNVSQTPEATQKFGCGKFRNMFQEEQRLFSKERVYVQIQIKGNFLVICKSIVVVLFQLDTYAFFQQFTFMTLRLKLVFELGRDDFFNF